MSQILSRIDFFPELIFKAFDDNFSDLLPVLDDIFQQFETKIEDQLNRGNFKIQFEFVNKTTVAASGQSGSLQLKCFMELQSDFLSLL